MSGPCLLFLSLALDVCWFLCAVDISVVHSATHNSVTSRTCQRRRVLRWGHIGTAYGLLSHPLSEVAIFYTTPCLDCFNIGNSSCAVRTMQK